MVRLLLIYVDDNVDVDVVNKGRPRSCRSSSDDQGQSTFIISYCIFTLATALSVHFESPRINASRQEFAKGSRGIAVADL